MDLASLIKRIDAGLAAEAAKGEGADANQVAKLEAQKSALETVDGGRELSRFAGPNGDPRAVEEFVRNGGLHTLSAVSVGGKGWLPGHWSEPFAKAAHGDGKTLTPSGAITVPSLSSGLVPINDRDLRLLDVIPVEPLTGTDSFAYLRETVREHKAAETAPGTKKPVSTYSLKKIEDRTRTIAHLTEPFQRQILDDVALLRPYIDDALRAGVMLRFDRQVLLGDGTGENIRGLANDPDRKQQEWVEDLLTTSRKAVTTLEDEEIMTGVFVLAPEVWEALELMTTSNGEYYLGGPINRARKTLWDARVIVTSALSGAPERGFYVDFPGSTKAWERETVRIDWSEAVFDPNALGEGVGAADFEMNLVRARGEARYGFGVTRPRGVVEFPTVDPEP
jgi:HK97 family phage major capsid protein